MELYHIIRSPVVNSYCKRVQNNLPMQPPALQYISKATSTGVGFFSGTNIQNVMFSKYSYRTVTYAVQLVIQILLLYCSLPALYTLHRSGMAGAYSDSEQRK